MINSVVIVGRLTRDIELRYTQDKIAVVSFSIAVDRPQLNKSEKRGVDFINCTAWRNTAEFAAKYAAKGAIVGVQGRLQVRTYENKEGRKVSSSDVLCENFQIYEWKKDPVDRTFIQPTTNNQTSDNLEPFEPQLDTESAIEQEGLEDKFNLSDDDLPF